MSKMQMTA